MRTATRILAALAAGLVSASAADTTVVSTPSGELECHMSAGEGPGVVTCRSVPYAEPPVGDKRWKQSTGDVTWPKVLSALNDPPGCMQECQLQKVVCPPTMSEDCLYLNVFAPATSVGADASLPVMVFFHGGNFKQGFAGGPLYDGTYFANTTDTILVASNYRLGSFGSFYSADLAGSLPGGSLGIHDQQLALEWVQKNIAAFGGDPSRVTIFGQSAGAQSVSTHLILESSSQYYDKAIMESAPMGLRYRNTAEAGEVVTAMASDLGCPKPSDDPSGSAQCFMAANASAVLAAQVKTARNFAANWPQELLIFEPWVPIVGPPAANATFIPGQPHEVYATQGIQGDKDVMFGTVENEGVLFVYEAFPKPLPKWEADLLLTFIFNLTDVEPLSQEYPVSNTSDARVPVSAIATGGLFTCVDRNATIEAQAVGKGQAAPSLRGSPASSSMGSVKSLYSYRFDHLPSFSSFLWSAAPACLTKVCHGDELPFVFHPFQNFIPLGIKATDAEKELSQVMVEYWTSFAHTGVPSSPTAGVAWPTYATDSGGSVSTETMWLQTGGVEVKSDIFAQECGVWNEYGYNFP